MKVSILILTFNEETNLVNCLGALSWCDDILVVDSGSTDSTVEIARRHGARILMRNFDDFAQQRNFGLNEGKFRHEWVLHLDADEIATPEFVSALSALAVEDGIDAYRVPAKMMLFGRWLRHAGMYPTYQVRLGHRDRLRFIQVGHGQREDVPASRVGVLSEPYLHYSFSNGMRSWLVKHVRYAADEANLILQQRHTKYVVEQAHDDSTSARRRAKARASRIPFLLRPAARFFYVYIARLGFLDGRAGFVYAFMLAVYEGMTAVIAYENIVNSEQQASDSGGRSRAKSAS